MSRLSAELHDISHKITPLLWSGENSIFVRDEAAHVLAEHLSAEHTEQPQATQLVIAHSHGGNIALRAFHHLQQRDASQSSGADSANPLVVTLATPFIEVHQADFGPRPDFIRAVRLIFVVVALLLFPLLTSIILFPSFWDKVFGLGESIVAMLNAIVVTPIVLFGFWSIKRRATARQNRLDALKNATRLGELTSAQRLVAIRAIDDEASLVMALGTILNYLAAWSIPIAFWLYLWEWIILGFVFSLFDSWAPTPVLAAVLAAGLPVLIIILFGLLMLSRSVHGHELAVSPMECQINTQSAPDAVGLSKIITLVWRTYVKSLRHKIYDHEDCPKAISDWVRSQLCACL
ncbi:MAG: hypothetical protein WA615_18900 [Bradyrhizobium sp.]|uniref:hypothetical protein n=1 Tax=Bradyrhizobium sp. TaxID=376 RepID=UPI003C7E8E6D